MLIKIIDWTKVLSIVSEKTGRTKKSIGMDMGISGNSIGSMCGAQQYPEPKYSEGDVLLGLYRSVTDNPVPKISRPEDVRCPCCLKIRSRADFMRTGPQKFRCTTCIDRISKANRK